MKQIFTFIAVLFFAAQANAQCTITGFDVCTGASPVTSFTNAILVSGNVLANGAKYKFNNITTGIGALDAIVSIDGNSKATLLNFDDDSAADETLVAGTQAALFSPKIVTDSDLKGNAQSGYVQFTITFYLHYAANTLPPITSLPVPVANLNFLHFDMDGYKVGTNGWFKETGFVKRPSLQLTDLINLGSAGSELISGGTVPDQGANWAMTYGSTAERDGVSRCAQVIEKSVFALPQSSVTLRMGYDYKPASPYANQSAGRPARQYGSKFGCFSLPNAAPLPVSLLGFGVSYKNGVSSLNWNTAQEISISDYEIERSVDGFNFQVVGKVTARNSMVEQRYFFDDKDLPNATVLYYRLKINGIDHNVKSSNIVTVRLSNAKSKEISITPNPSSNNAQIRFNAEKAGLATIVVFDANGKTVLKQQSTILVGNNSVVINNISNLKDGMYTVKMMLNNESLSTKLIVWK